MGWGLQRSPWQDRRSSRGGWQWHRPAPVIKAIIILPPEHISFPILQRGPFRLNRCFCAKKKFWILKMCKQQFLLIPSKPQKAAIAHHPERGPLVLSAFHCWILNNLLKVFNLQSLFILHSCLPVGPRSQIHSHSIISQCFPSSCFVKMSQVLL